MNELARKCLENELKRLKDCHRGGNFHALNLQRQRDKLGRFKCRIIKEKH